MLGESDAPVGTVVVLPDSISICFILLCDRNETLSAALSGYPFILLFGKHSFLFLSIPCGKKRKRNIIEKNDGIANCQVRGQYPVACSLRLGG